MRFGPSGSLSIYRHQVINQQFRCCTRATFGSKICFAQQQLPVAARLVARSRNRYFGRATFFSIVICFCCAIFGRGRNFFQGGLHILRSPQKEIFFFATQFFLLEGGEGPFLHRHNRQITFRRTFLCPIGRTYA